jgi:hypothetical protein
LDSSSGNASSLDYTDSSSQSADSASLIAGSENGQQAGSADSAPSVYNPALSSNLSGSSSSDNPAAANGSGSDTSSGSKGSGQSLSGPDLSESSDSTGTSSAGSAEREIQNGISIIINQENAQLNSLSAQHPSGQDPARQSRDAAAIAAASLASLSSLKGTHAAQLAAQASVIQDSLTHLSAAEKEIATRNGIFTFLFGGDKASAIYIQDRVDRDLAALDSMDKILNDPSVSPSIKSFVGERESRIRADLMRLRGIAYNEVQKKGLFG